MWPFSPHPKAAGWLWVPDTDGVKTSALASRTNLAQTIRFATEISLIDEGRLLRNRTNEG